MNALVFDFGHSWTKAGHAGEDSPKMLFSSTVGMMSADADGDTEMLPESKYIFGDVRISAWNPNVELKSLYNAQGSSNL